MALVAPNTAPAPSSFMTAMSNVGVEHGTTPGATTGNDVPVATDQRPTAFNPVNLRTVSHEGTTDSATSSSLQQHQGTSNNDVTSMYGAVAAPAPPPSSNYAQGSYHTYSVDANGNVVQMQAALAAPSHQVLPWHNVSSSQQQHQEPSSPKQDYSSGVVNSSSKDSSAAYAAVAVTPPRNNLNASSVTATRKIGELAQGVIPTSFIHDGTFATTTTTTHVDPREAAFVAVAAAAAVSKVKNDAAGSVLAPSPSVSSRQPFPQKLMEMLSKEGVEQPHVVSWLPHGRAFIVTNRKIFTTEIMPRYFRLTKFPSFQRQLNLYGFRMLTKGKDSGSYYHDLFLRDQPERCAEIRRDAPSNSSNSNSLTTSKGAASSKTPSPPPPSVMASTIGTPMTSDQISVAFSHARTASGLQANANPMIVVVPPPTSGSSSSSVPPAHSIVHPYVISSTSAATANGVPFTTNSSSSGTNATTGTGILHCSSGHQYHPHVQISNENAQQSSEAMTAAPTANATPMIMAQMPMTTTTQQMHQQEHQQGEPAPQYFHHSHHQLATSSSSATTTGSTPSSTPHVHAVHQAPVSYHTTTANAVVVQQTAAPAMATEHALMHRQSTAGSTSSTTFQYVVQQPAPASASSAHYTYQGQNLYVANATGAPTATMVAPTSATGTTTSTLARTMSPPISYGMTSSATSMAQMDGCSIKTPETVHSSVPNKAHEDQEAAHLLMSLMHTRTS